MQILSAALTAALLGGTAHQEHKYVLPTNKAKNEYSALYYAVRDEQGKRAPGRNIRKNGVLRKDGSVRKASAKEIASSIRTLRLLHRPLLVASKPTIPPSGAMTARAGGTLTAIAACESGGDPSAVSASGTFRGKYQFDQQTWNSVGGSGDPAAASEAEQDQRAATLYARRGSAPWPVCGQ